MRTLFLLVLLFLIQIAFANILLDSKDGLVEIDNEGKRVKLIFYSPALSPLRVIKPIRGKVLAASAGKNFIYTAGIYNGRGSLFAFDFEGIKLLKLFPETDSLSAISVSKNGYIGVSGEKDKISKIYITDPQGNVIYSEKFPLCGKPRGIFWNGEKALFIFSRCKVLYHEISTKVERFSVDILTGYEQNGKIVLVFNVDGKSIDITGKVLAKEAIKRVINCGGELFSISDKRIWRNGSVLLALPKVEDAICKGGMLFILVEGRIIKFDTIELR